METVKCYRMSDLKEVEILVEGVHESWCKLPQAEDQFESVFSARNDALLKLNPEDFEKKIEQIGAPKDFQPGDLIFVITPRISGPVFVHKASVGVVWFYPPEGGILKRVEKADAILLSRPTKKEV